MAPVINALAFALPVGLCCISICVSFRMLRFADLGLTGAFVVGAYAYGVSLLRYDSIVLATIAAVVGGASVGAMTGIVHYRLRVNSLLAGIATFFVFRSIAARLALSLPAGASAQTPIVKFDTPRGVADILIDLMPSANRLVGSHSLPLPHALLTAVAITVAATATAAFAHLRLGVVLRAFGDNREAAIESNFPFARLGMLGLSLAGIFAALGGASLMFTNAIVTIDSGSTILLESFAAFFLGESLARSLRRPPAFRYSFGQVMLTSLGGTAIYQFLRNVTQVLATRVGWLETTDYGFFFALLLVLLGHLVARDDRSLVRPVPVY